MAKLFLTRKSTTRDDSVSGYRMTLEITASEDITPKVFVNQRLRNYNANTFTDVFAAVCTVAQIEDLAPDAPEEGTSFYRTHKVDIISRNLDYLNDVYGDIVYELQKLVQDMNAMTVMKEQEDLVIDASDITSQRFLLITEEGQLMNTEDGEVISEK